MKTNVTLSLDIEVRREAKQLNINLSNVLEESLTNLIRIKKGDVNEQTINLEKEKLLILEQKHSQMSGEMAGIREKIANYDEKKQKNKEEELKMEEKRIESINICAVCKGELTQNSVLFKPGVKIHKSCFANLDINTIQKLDNLMVNIKYECQKCGNIISLLTDKNQEPEKCGCGNTTRFKVLGAAIVEDQEDGSEPTA